MLFTLVAVGASPATRIEVPSTFTGDRVFATPHVAGSARRLTLWIDTDGSGFIRSTLVDELKLHTERTVAGGQAKAVAFLPRLDNGAFPPLAARDGALPVLGSDVAGDPIFAGIDGQLGWSWLDGRIWTFDYVGHHLWLDAAALPPATADIVPLHFDALHRYPSIDIVVEGTMYRAALDTASSIALNAAAAARLDDGRPAVRATSFIPHSTMNAWHAAHPQWRFIADAGRSAGISMIQVPRVAVGAARFSDVWFSTRPHDDVFERETVDAKLGPTAFSHCSVTIDYLHDEATFACL